MKIHYMLVTVSTLLMGVVDATSAHLKIHRLNTSNSRKYVRRGSSTIEFGRSIDEAQAV
jgi:hypothetical protein